MLLRTLEAVRKHHTDCYGAKCHSSFEGIISSNENEDSNGGAYSLIHQEFQMAVVINSWIPSVLMEN